MEWLEYPRLQNLEHEIPLIDSLTSKLSVLCCVVKQSLVAQTSLNGGADAQGTYSDEEVVRPAESPSQYKMPRTNSSHSLWFKQLHQHPSTF